MCTVLAVALATATYGVQHTALSGKPLWRDSGCIALVYDAATVSPATASVLDASFAAWASATASCSGLTFVSRIAPVGNAVDGVTTVHVRSDGWPYAPDIASITRLTFVDDPSDPDDGKILEADMELNAVDFALVAPGDPPPVTAKTVLDLESVATHEAGHLLGLAHDCGTGLEPWPADQNGNPVAPCDGADPSIVAAAMYYHLDSGDTSKRQPRPNDVAGACSIVRGAECNASYVGGCATGGTHGPLLIVAIAWICRKERKWAERGR